MSELSTIKTKSQIVVGEQYTIQHGVREGHTLKITEIDVENKETVILEIEVSLGRVVQFQAVVKDLKIPGE